MTEILHARVSHTRLIIYAKSFFSYGLPVGQVTSLTDGQTDDNHANSSTVT